MDTRTGEIYEMADHETLSDLAKRVGSTPAAEFVQLGKKPDGACPKCGGRGSRRAGLNSKRFVPCECTFDECQAKEAYKKAMEKAGKF